MHRIAAALPIAATVLALNGGVLSPAVAGELAAKRPAPSAEISQPAIVRNAKVLSLLMILESLRVAPLLETGQKV